MERLLITTLARKGTTAELTARGHQYADLTLFELSDLVDVGIDPATLPEGAPQACRFWAYYTLSSKLNKAGNPYKDVAHLEPYTNGTPAANLPPQPAPAYDLAAALDRIHAQMQELVALRAVVDELVAMRGLLAEIHDHLIAGVRQLPAEAQAELAPFSAPDPDRYFDGSQLSDRPAERAAFAAYLAATGTPPANLEDLRRWCRSTGWTAARR